jgi:hypothetical protein
VGRTTPGWITLTFLVGAALSGCGDDDGDTGDNGSEDPVVVQITFQDGQVEPNGERIDVDAGQPIDLQVIADEPGEIHIHSDPEKEIPYEAGEQTIEIQIDKPGVVEVESHELEQVIVQLEVR